jgi:hypothetical protein
MKKVLVVAWCFLMLGVAGPAFSTPIYNGNTDGGGFTATQLDPNTNELVQIPQLPPITDPAAAGYYVWSNDPERLSWSVRWTGATTEGNPLDKWFGSIEFQGRDLTEASRVLWELVGTNQDGNLNIDLQGATQDSIYWTRAFAGSGWDGFDFMINPEIPGPGKVIGFNLGSTLFNDLAFTDQGASSGIFIGDTKNAPLVLVDNFKLYGEIVGKSQNFEIPAPIPEPSTLLLLGAGLVGLVYVKRRRDG